MFKCIECGAEFEQPKTYDEYMGECHGVPAYQTFSCCPQCNGDYEEAVSCTECGENFLQEDLEYGLCKNCLGELKALLKEKYKQMISICNKYGVDDYDVIVDAMDEFESENNRSSYLKL